MSAIKFGGGGGNNKVNIEEIISQIHNHDNLEVLDELNDSNGRLTYKGQEVVLSGASGSTILASQVIETNDRKFVSKTEKEALSGVVDNIQGKFNEYNNKFKETMFYKGVYDTYAKMTSLNNSPENGWTTFVNNDETNEGAKSIYIYKDKTWVRVRTDKSGAGWVAQPTPPSTDLLWLDTSNASSVTIKWHNGIGWRNIGGSSLPISATDVTEETNRKFVSDINKAILDNMEEDPSSGGLTYKGVLLGAGGSGAAIDDTSENLDKTYSSIKITKLLEAKQDVFTYVPENVNAKNKPNGYAGLTEEGFVQCDLLPRDALYKTFEVKNEQERLTIANTAKSGDYAYETTTGKLYIKTSDPNASNDHWSYLADAYKMNQSAINKLDAQYNPTADDDETAGYSAGSIWVNIIDKKSYICTDATATAAKWDLMGGQVSLAIGEIVPFVYDENMPGRIEGQTEFPLPSFMYDECYIEVSMNGLELVRGKDYEVVENSGDYTLVMTSPTSITDIINGEIFQQDITNIQEYMTKSQYDSNHDGVVDRAEKADAVAGLSIWESGTSYKTGNMIRLDKEILIANKNFRSGLELDSNNWDKLYAMPSSLEEFTTKDLIDSTDRRYVSDKQKEDINKIPTILSDIRGLTRTDERLQEQINKVVSYIPSGTDVTNKLVNSNQFNNAMKALRLKDLADTSSSYVPEGFLQVNQNGNIIEYVKDPRFPIMKVTDRRGNEYEDIYNLEIKHFEKESFDDGKLILEPKMKSTHLLDMPKIEKHGALLISNQTLMQYDLVPADELTLSQENFYCEIGNDQWIENEDKYEYIVEHNLDSEALIISIVDTDKVEVKNVTYQIIDSTHVKFIAESDAPVKVTINCSLGVVNGYWNHIFDISKITLLNDTEARLDRTYSSMKLEEMLSKLADKDLVYSRKEANNIFATKDNEHTHSNFNCLNKITEDNLGNVMYNGKKLLTDIKGKTIEISRSFNYSEVTEIVNVKDIAIEKDINTILSSEIVIKNNSNDEMSLLIKDGSIVLIDEKMPANGVQKYVLGVSTGTTVSVSGSGSFNYYISQI